MFEAPRSPLFSVIYILCFIIIIYNLIYNQLKLIPLVCDNLYRNTNYHPVQGSWLVDLMKRSIL